MWTVIFPVQPCVKMIIIYGKCHNPVKTLSSYSMILSEMPSIIDERNERGIKCIELDGFRIKYSVKMIGCASIRWPQQSALNLSK